MGGLTLPKELRKKLGLEKGGVVMAEISAQGILLKPAVTFPIEIYSDERIREFEKEDALLAAQLKRKTK